MDKFEFYFQQGLQLLRSGKTDQAYELFNQALKINPNSPHALVNTGIIYLAKSQFNEARNVFEKALKLNPTMPEVYLNLGVALRELGQLDMAIKIYHQGLTIKPDHAGILGNLGSFYRDKGQPRIALKYFQQAYRSDPGFSGYIYNIGNLYHELGDKNKSIKYYKQAIGVNPSYFKAHFNLGVCYQDLDQPDKAVKSYLNATRANPDFEDAWGNLVVTLRQICEWELMKQAETNLRALNQKSITQGTHAGEHPFYTITSTDDLKYSQDIARSWSKELENKLGAEKFTSWKKHQGKIRLGFASDGFRVFPTSYNIIGLLEKIDRKKFDVILYSWGIDDKSKLRKRAEKLATKFVDTINDYYIRSAEKIHEDSIDILIDLKGYSRGTRVKIMFLKPAPIIISLLGFSGTMGSKTFDYIFADKTTVPLKDTKYYDEKIIYMPDTYWPADNKLKISNKNFKREAFKIPKEAVVFGSFNQTYKITPEIFASWMNILRRVPKSVLILWSDNKFSEYNLKVILKLGGIEVKRVIFVKQLPKNEHLARIKGLVDLVLDTNMVNGHTSTTDALWAGVPVLTIQGKHFMASVSASMLKAIGLPELITKNLKEYEDLAVKLAKSPKLLKSLKAKLAANKKTFPLFDTEKYTKNFEKALKAIYNRYQKNLTPTHIFVK